MIRVSKLPKTWLLDLDGTLVKHNGYLIDGHDTLLEGVTNFFDELSSNDMVVILTARKSEYKDETLKFLKENKIRYDHIFFDCPVGERIVINDDKPQGLKTGLAINIKRNQFKCPETQVEIDETL